ncbi:MAG: hypothetical protein AYK18_09825 [Theionarchaea archaeon DG-70]|nr:MAG: hypothetical protein AYK18_09825 [Theionarchaea archaeon DG-70]
MRLIPKPNVIAFFQVLFSMLLVNSLTALNLSSAFLAACFCCITFLLQAFHEDLWPKHRREK